MPRWLPALFVAIFVLLAAAVAHADPQVPCSAEASAIPAAAFEKLSPDQVVEVLREREQARVAQIAVGKSDVSIGVPIAFFLGLVSIVSVTLFFRFTSDRQRHQTLRAAIEKGVELPPALLVPPVRRSDLRPGLILLGLGVGVALFFLVQGQWRAMGLGLVPACLGIGFLLVWKIESRRAVAAERG